jgi:membrane-bound lytic murein transglycosylase D
MGVWPVLESKISGAAVVASGSPGSSSTLPAKIMLASADNSRYWSRNSMPAAEKQEAKTAGSNPAPAGYSSAQISATADLEPEKDNSGGGASTVRTASPFQPVVYAPQVKPAEVVLGNYGVERVWCQEGKTFGLIRVEVEETLGHYADWLGVSARRLRRLNGLRYGRILRLNQKIKIPLSRVGKEAFEEKRFEYHQQLAEDFFASYRVEKVLTYRVKRGDNIWTLSRREFELPLWLIKHYNADVDFNALIPSQKLLIPVVEKNV